MYKQPGQEELLFYMLYTTAAVLSLIASCYLLFRQGNAFAKDVTSPVRLRRWTAAFFAALTLSHMWYLPSVFLTSDDDILLCNSIGALLDCMTVFPLAIIVMPFMLQDRRRPLWPVAVMMISRQDTTYNAYINDLRINHFIRLYREAVDNQRLFTTKQLAHSSGYRSYSTFTLAFKQRMGKNVTAWISELAG